MYNIFPKNKYIFLEPIEDKKVIDEEDIFFFQQKQNEQKLFDIYSVIASGDSSIDVGATVLVEETMVQTVVLNGFQVWFCSISGIIACLEKR